MNLKIRVFKRLEDISSSESHEHDFKEIKPEGYKGGLFYRCAKKACGEEVYYCNL